MSAPETPDRSPSRSCVDETRRLLAEIPSLAAQCASSLVPSTSGGPDGPRPAPASRPPLSVDLLDLSDGREIYNWVRLVYETMMDLHCPQPGPAGWNEEFRLDVACAWLAEHTEWIIGQFPEPERVYREARWCALYCPDGHYLTAGRVRRDGGRYHCRMCHQGFAAEIAQLHAAYCRAAGVVVHKAWPCPDCQWRLEPKGDLNADGQAVLHVCHGCGRIWRLKELEDRLARIEDQTGADAANAVTLAYAAGQVGRSVSTLKDWVQAGMLEPLGFDRQRNARLFPLDQIRRLAAEQPSRTRKAS